MKTLKQLFWGACLIAGLSLLTFNNSAYAEGVEKKVCEDKKDSKGAVVKGKDGKTIQTCKTIKVHKKLEGTKVPEKK
jgi:hypothetical protein